MSNPLTRTNWKQWKRGFRYGMLGGLFQGIIAYGVVKKIEWYELGMLILVNIATAGMLYMQKHPIEEVTNESDTDIINRK